MIGFQTSRSELKLIDLKKACFEGKHRCDSIKFDQLDLKNRDIKFMHLNAEGENLIIIFQHLTEVEQVDEDAPIKFEPENSSEYIIERWCTDSMTKEAMKKIKVKVSLENEDISASFDVVLIYDELKLIVSKVETLELYSMDTLRKEERFDTGEKKSISNLFVSPCKRILIVEEVKKIVVWDI
jgi:hypothetical protein